MAQPDEPMVLQPIKLQRSSAFSVELASFRLGFEIGTALCGSLSPGQIFCCNAMERSALHRIYEASDPTAKRIIEVAEGPGEHRETVPLVEERAIVRKREKVTDAVRVRTVVHEDEAIIDEPFAVEEFDVERVAVDRWVDEPAQVRQEGEVTIIPVHEEVVVTEKRLRVAEEIRITRRRVTRRAEQRLTLRREEAVVERPDGATPGSGDPG